MMRSAMAAAVLLAGLAACSPTESEEALAKKIVDAQGVLDLGEETLNSVVGSQLQGVAMQTPSITPEQAEKLEKAIRKNIEAELPALKKDIAGFLGESFDAKELKTYYDFVGSKEGDTIKDRIPPVMQKSLEAADKMTSAAVDKAVTEVMGTAPTAPAPQPNAAAPAPAEPAKPTKPQ